MTKREESLKNKIRLLIHGDSPVVNTGFGVVTKAIAERLIKTGKYHIIAVGINDRGTERHPLDDCDDFTRIPVPHLDRDPYGYEILPQALVRYKPEVLFFLNDIWLLTGSPQHNNVDWVYRTCKQYAPQSPIIIYFPVDGDPWEARWWQLCEMVDKAVVYSDYGERVLKDSGYEGKLYKIYHGVDLDKFHTVHEHIRNQQRKELGVPEGNKLIGIFSRNQPRKNVPIAIRIIKLLKDGYVRCANCKNLYSPERKNCPTCRATERVDGDTFEGMRNISTYFHMNFDDRMGFNLRKILIDENLSDIIYNPQHNIAYGYPIEKLNLLYNAMDVMFLPTTAEGYGLPILESMACGVPVVATDCTAVTELLENDQGFPVAPQDYIIMQDAPNTRKFIIDVEKSIHALKEALTNKEKVEDVRMNAMMYAHQRSWDTSAEQFDNLIQETLNERISIVDSFKGGKDKRKLFFIRQAGDGGDILCTLPAIKGVKENFKDAEVVYAIPKEFHEIVNNIPYIDNVIDSDKLWDGSRTQKNYQVAIAKFPLLGPEIKYEEATIPNIDKSRHEIFVHSCGFKPSSFIPDIFLSEEEKETGIQKLEELFGDKFKDEKFKKVVLKVDAPEEYKKWPNSHWKTLASSLGRFKDLLTLIITEKKTHKDWEDWYNSLEDESIKERIKILNEYEFGIRNVWGALRRFNLLVSTDGPYIHYAGSLGVPILGLYGPISAQQRLKHYKNINAITKQAMFNTCLPCGRNAHTPCAINQSLTDSACMNEISSGEVFARIGTLLNPILSRAANKKRKEVLNVKN